jgi:DNA-binding LytR/AlgR family response regulator
MYKCIIVDDEPIAIRVIKNHLLAFIEFEVVAECGNALEAIPILSNENIDLMFCDIQMPQLTGVDFVRSLAHPPKVIFTTAYRDYAVDAFELQVVDYLLKPISFERFTRAINNFLKQSNKQVETKRINNTSEYIFLKADKKHLKVNLSDILYFESLGDYVIAHTTDDKIVSKERIGFLAKNLPEHRFMQIHRGFVVSIDKIESVGPGFIEIDKKKLPVGRNYKQQVSKLIKDGLH